MQNTTEVLLLRVGEAAKLLAISRSKAYELIASNLIPSVKIGQRSVRVPADQLKAQIERQTTSGSGGGV